MQDTTLQKLTELFKALEIKFPYTQGFKGHHHIYMRSDEILIINTWCKDKLWQTGLEEGDLDNIPKLVETINNMITHWK